MVSHGFNPSTGEAEAGRPAEFKDSLVYMWSGIPDSQNYIERPWGDGGGREREREHRTFVSQQRASKP